MSGHTLFRRGGAFQDRFGFFRPHRLSSGRGCGKMDKNRERGTWPWKPASKRVYSGDSTGRT